MGIDVYKCHILAYIKVNFFNADRSFQYGHYTKLQCAARTRSQFPIQLLNKLLISCDKQKVLLPCCVQAIIKSADKSPDTLLQDPYLVPHMYLNPRPYLIIIQSIPDLLVLPIYTRFILSYLSPSYTPVSIYIPFSYPET